MPTETRPIDIDSTLAVRDRQIEAVHAIAERLSSTLDLDERLRDILAVSLKAVEANAGTIFLHRLKDDKLVFEYVVGEKSRELTGFAMNAHAGVVGAVFQTGQAQITNRPLESPEFAKDVGESVGFRTESIITVPLKYQAGEPVGAMQILNKRTGEFLPSDLAVLEIIAAMAAAAIENARLAREAQVAAVAHAVGDLSHDIKNKVTPISMAVYTLRPTIAATLSDLDGMDAQLSPECRQVIASATKWLRQDYAEQFDIIEDQVLAVQEYTKRIADALKGTITEPQLELHDLSPIIEEQIRQLEPIARGRGVSLRSEVTDVPRFRLDQFFMKSAVYNLVNNAIPETPENGSVTVRASVCPGNGLPIGDSVVIEVTDTGRGMPPHILEGVLRGDAKSSKPGGTGLGTRIVYNAVAAHKGLFEGESHEGVGTTFRMKLPLITE